MRTINTKIIDERDAAGNVAISRLNRIDVYQPIEKHPNDAFHPNEKNQNGFQPNDNNLNDVFEPMETRRNEPLQSIDRNLFSDVEVDDVDDVFGVVENGNSKPEMILPIPAPRVRPIHGIRKPMSVDSVSLMDEIVETLGIKFLLVFHSRNI